MVKEAQQVKAGEFVNVGDVYLGRVHAVQRNQGSVVLHHVGGSLELSELESVDAWGELPRVAARLPHCISIEVSQASGALQWKTRHNGRVIDTGRSYADERETRIFAKNCLEAMGLIQDGC